MVNILYLSLYVILKLALFIWFNSISVTGKKNIPQTGPIIFAANHPNMVLDPVLIAASCGRMDGHFWAKQSLFHGIFGWILRQVGGVPVFRRTDTGKMSADEHHQATDKLFSASYEILEKGEVLIIFPEGTSYTAPHLQELKTGVARMSIGFARSSKKNLTAPIIPVGLNYISKDKFRSQVLIQYGEPIYPSKIEDSQNIEKEAVELTKKLESAIKSCTINASSWEDLVLLDLARQIYTSDHSLTLEQDIEIMRRASKTYEEFEDKQKVDQLKKKISDYGKKLDEYGLIDDYFSKSFRLQTLVSHLIVNSVKLFFSLLMAFPGLIIHLPLHLLTRLVDLRGAYVEERCQFKFGLIILFVPLMYSFLLIFAWFLFGVPVAAVSLIVLPFLGYLHVLELEEGTHRARSMRSLMKLIWLLITSRTELEAIKAQRDEITKMINHIVEEFWDKKKIDRVLNQGQHVTEGGILDTAETKVHIKTYTTKL